MTQEYEILRDGTIVEYVLYRYFDFNDKTDKEVRREGNIISFDEGLRKYHVGMKQGDKWTRYGMQWVHPSDVIRVVEKDEGK